MSSGTGCHRGATRWARRKFKWLRLKTREHAFLHYAFDMWMARRCPHTFLRRCDAVDIPKMDGGTRGQVDCVVLVGQKKAVAIAVRNVSGRTRWSKLREWLSADVSKRDANA